MNPDSDTDRMPRMRFAKYENVEHHRGRYVRFVALASPNNEPWAGAAEIDVPKRCIFPWRAAGVSPLIEVANLTRYIYRKTSPPVNSRTACGTFDLVEKSGA